MKTPAVPLCLAFVGGILFRPLVPAAFSMTLAAVFLAGALHGVRVRRLRAGSIAVLAAFVALGASASTLHRDAIERASLVPSETPTRVTGRLRAEPETRGASTRMVVDVGSDGVRVHVHGERREVLDTLTAGDRVQFWTTLREPSSFRNLGSFDGVAHDERRHIVLSGSVKSGLLVRPLERSSRPRAIVSRARRDAHRVLEAALADPDVYGVVAALVTGSRAALSPELERLYRRAGIFHVMAISGAHVAIWILCVHASLRFMGVSRRTSFKILLAVLPIYAAFCGARAPVVRAVLMAILWIGSELASVRSPRLNGLAVAVLCLLVWEPASLADAGFQLTTSAMLAIAALYEPLAARLAIAGRFAPVLAVSIAAQLGTLPVSAWHFHRIHPFSLLASPVAMPVAALVGIFGVAVILTAGAPWIGSAVVSLTELSVSALTGVARLAALIPGASIRVAAPGAFMLLAYVAALLAMRYGSTRSRRVGAVCFAGVIGWGLVPVPARPGALEVTLLDVGHGDAVVVGLPEGGAVLVDAGGLPRSSLDVGESVIVPYLLDRGLTHLRALVVTHADYDHIGGVRTVLRELGADAVWEGHPDRGRDAYEAMAAEAEALGIPIRLLETGERIELGGATFEVLSAGDAGVREPNNRSVVLAVAFAGRRVLLTGDAERELERKMLASGVDLKADILKIAHHGSRTSTTKAFLDAVDPRFAIISARENRSRPIPAESVLERLRDNGVEYRRTDEDGAVTVTIDEHGNVMMTTFLQSS